MALTTIEAAKRRGSATVRAAVVPTFGGEVKRSMASKAQKTARQNFAKKFGKKKSGKTKSKKK